MRDLIQMIYRWNLSNVWTFLNKPFNRYETDNDQESYSSSHHRGCKLWYLLLLEDLTNFTEQRKWKEAFKLCWKLPDNRQIIYFHIFWNQNHNLWLQCICWSAHTFWPKCWHFFRPHFGSYLYLYLLIRQEFSAGFTPVTG